MAAKFCDWVITRDWTIPTQVLSRDMILIEILIQAAGRGLSHGYLEIPPVEESGRYLGYSSNHGTLCSNYLTSEGIQTTSEEVITALKNVIKYTKYEKVTVSNTNSG